MPGDGVMSAATWVGPFPVTGMSVIKSDWGRGVEGRGDGGGGVVTLGGLGGFVGWSLFVDPLFFSTSSTSELICTGGRDDTLGQISSSLI